MKNKLGEDLEKIIDGEYVFLRRKSAKLIPIFCVFSYTSEDLIVDGQPTHKGKKRVRFNFDERLFEGFANEKIRNVVSDLHRFTLAAIQPKPFVEKIKNRLNEKNQPFNMDMVKYIDMSKEFFY